MRGHSKQNKLFQGLFFNRGRAWIIFYYFYKPGSPNSALRFILCFSGPIPTEWYRVVAIKLIEGHEYESHDYQNASGIRKAVCAKALKET